MPLRCETPDGVTIQATDCDEAQWEALRVRNRERRDLIMPCCNADTVLKKSPRGTRFFAHKPSKHKARCHWKPETEVHRHLKTVALNAARNAGWTAHTEEPGTTPDGEEWTADVLARKGRHIVAVEIQWSGQTNDETMKRQERYRQSGVRGLWLLRQPDFPNSKDLPAACIGGSLEDRLKILIPRHDPDFDRRSRRNVNDWLQIVEPEAFMQAVFERRFRFGAEHAREVQARIETGTMECWRCRRDTRIVIGLRLRVGPYEDFHDLSIADEMPELEQRIREALSHHDDIGAVRTRYSRTVQGRYVANSCAHCDALIGRFYEHRAWYDNNSAAGQLTWALDAATREVLAYTTGRWAVWDKPPA